nr:uncharacterized protein LOC101240438 [Hydra vulgaris]
MCKLNQDWLAHSNDDSDNEELNPNENNLDEDLGKWAVSFKIPHSGEYYYIGLQFRLSLLLKKSLLSTDLSVFTLHINIDGVPLFNNSSILLWAILGSILEFEQSVFPIALFSSSCKPNSIDKYLIDFIDKMERFQEVGVICDKTGKAYKIKLEAVICNAPAWSFLKCIKTHNGYNCCKRCIQHGEWCQKIVLPNLSALLMTNIDFLNRHDSEHHTATSPFTKLKYNMVSGFRIDYMHCICLGAVRRVLHLWICGPPSCWLFQTFPAAAAVPANNAVAVVLAITGAALAKKLKSKVLS